MEDVQQAPSQAPSDYVSDASFDDLGLSEPVRRAIAERGYAKPTPVQSASYRPIRDGKDVIVRSKTGTGKTAAFGIPILERIPDGTWELVCHPGYDDADLAQAGTRLRASRVKELELLTAPALQETLERYEIKLLSYNDLQ